MAAQHHRRQVSPGVAAKAAAAGGTVPATEDGLREEEVVRGGPTGAVAPATAAAEDMEEVGEDTAGEGTEAAAGVAGAAISAAEDGSSRILPAPWSCADRPIFHQLFFFLVPNSFYANCKSIFFLGSASSYIKTRCGLSHVM